MNRLKTYDATGIAPNGRLFSGDLNALQDAVAALTDLTQHISVVDLAIGESGLLLSRFGAGEARITGALRTDGIMRGLGGLFAGTYTTTARDAIAAGSRPFGLIILNTTTARYEWNLGTDASPVWVPIGSSVSYGTGFPGSPLNGDEHILVDSTTNPSYQWRCRYNANSTSPYKWECIGATEIVVAAATANLPAHAGDYIVTGKTWGGNGGSATGVNQQVDLRVAGVTVDTQVAANVPGSSSATFGYGGGASDWATGGMVAKVLGAASGAAVAIVGGGINPVITIKPVRLS